MQAVLAEMKAEKRQLLALLDIVKDMIAMDEYEVVWQNISNARLLAGNVQALWDLYVSIYVEMPCRTSET